LPVHRGDLFHRRRGTQPPHPAPAQPLWLFNLQRILMPPSTIRLGDNSYGKSGVRLMKVQRNGPGGFDTVKELSIDIALSGDFDAVHEGDNSKCLPTDTMKNTVYALARNHDIESIESFASHLA